MHHRIRVLALFVLSWPSTGPAQQPKAVCDPGLEERASGPHGYRLRGTRCEGIYGQEVGGDPLIVTSFTESFGEYTPSRDGNPPLTIEWTSPPSTEEAVTLRAQGMKRDLYYQMDTGLPAAAASYEWPSDVLAGRQISRQQLGVLAWIHRLVAGVERDVLLPLRIAQGTSPPHNSTYELTLFPKTALTEVYLTVAQLDDSGRVKRVVKNGVPLGYDDYPAQRPIRIPLADLGPAGIYQVEIGAVLESGSSVTLKNWFYHGTSAH